MTFTFMSLFFIQIHECHPFTWIAFYFYFYFFSQIKQLPYDSCGIPRQILVSTLSFPNIVDEMQ